MKRHVLRAAVIPFALTLAACGEGDGLLEGIDELDDGLVGGIPTNLTDPAAVIGSHAAALGAKNLDAYTALLEPEPAGRSAEAGFRFYPLDTDAAQFPWMTGDSWGAADELRFMGNMFDPEFSGAQPPVDSIEMGFTILSQREVQAPLYEITIAALITVLTAPDEGFSTDTKFIVLLARQADGYYRIREIREVPRQLRGAAAVAEASWGENKALYR
ncbi:MAG: hypothetical protein ACT4PE_03480 [Candidatus Eiseniibacteriota bacterium]